MAYQTTGDTEQKVMSLRSLCDQQTMVNANSANIPACQILTHLILSPEPSSVNSNRVASAIDLVLKIHKRKMTVIWVTWISLNRAYLIVSQLQAQFQKNSIPLHPSAAPESCPTDFGPQKLWDLGIEQPLGLEGSRPSQTRSCAGLEPRFWSRRAYTRLRRVDR